MVLNEYIFPISDFQDGVYQAQLQTEILEKFPRLHSTKLVGSNVVISFTKELTSEQKTELSELISSHAIIEPLESQNAQLVVQKDKLIAVVGAKKLQYYGSKSKVIKVDVEGQGDFTSINEALAAHPEPGYSFILYPGTYLVSNPIVLPEKTIVKSAVNDPANTIIVAKNPIAPIFVMDKQSALEKLMIVGAAGSGGVGVVFNGDASPPGIFSRIQGCNIIDCNIGIKVFGRNNACYFFETAIFALNYPIQKGIDISEGGMCGGDTLLVTGNKINKVNEGIVVKDDGTLFTMGSGIVSQCNVCTSVGPNGSINLSFFSIENSNIGVVVNNRVDDVDYPQTTCKMNNVTIRDMHTYHVSISGKKGEISFPGSKIQEDKLHNPFGARITGSPIFTEEDRKFHATFIGELRVGNHYSPTRFSTGEGYSTVTGNGILASENLESGPFINNTVAAASNDGSLFDLFNNLTNGSCAYIGSDSKFYGIKINIKTTISDLDASKIVYEYWNGDTWTDLKIMALSNNPPYASRGNIPLTVREIQFVDFGFTSSNNHVSKSIDGVHKFWIRMRLTSNISGTPQIEKIKTSHSHHTFQKDGYPIYFGDCRLVKTIDWKMSESPDAPPNNINHFFSKNLSMKGKNSLFPNGVLSKKVITSSIPSDINTAFPIKVRWLFIPQDAQNGTVRWVVKWNKVGSGSTVFSTIEDAPSIGDNEQSQIIDIPVSSSQKNSLVTATVDLDVNTFIFRPENGLLEDMLWLSIERDGADEHDTYSSSIAFFRLCQVKYVRIVENDHILSIY